MTAPDDMRAILQRMAVDADSLLKAADPLLAGQARALRSRIGVMLAVAEDVSGPAATERDP